MNRVQEVTKLYPAYVDLALSLAVPEHKNKYLKWIAAQLANKHSQEDVSSTVIAFHREAKRLKESDIYKYKDLKDLENEIKDLNISKRQLENLSKETGSIKLYSDDNCSLIRINSKSAMLFYGKGSRWCVAMEREEYWEQYSSNGNVFYILIDKSNNEKYAVQKEGLFNLTVWNEEDYDFDTEYWVTKNKVFENAIFACVHDREEPMLFRIKNRKCTKDEVFEWIKFQNETTIKYLTQKITSSGYYLLDTTIPISKETISFLDKFAPKDLTAFNKEKPDYILKVVDFLSKNKKISVKTLRRRLGNIIPNPNIILNEDDSNFILMKKDPSIASKLLLSTKTSVWKKALSLADSKDILSTIKFIDKTIDGEIKRNAFNLKLEKNIKFDNLIRWLSNDNINVPKEVWAE